MTDTLPAKEPSREQERIAYFADMMRYRANLSITHWRFSDALTAFAADHPGLSSQLLLAIADISDDTFDDPLTRTCGTIHAVHNIKFAIIALNRAQTDYSPDASNPLVTTRILWFGMEHEPTLRTC